MAENQTENPLGETAPLSARGTPLAESGTETARRERDRQAYALRLSGASYDQISRTLSIAISTAHAAVQRATREYQQQNDHVDELRALELARLDALTLTLWERMSKAEATQMTHLDLVRLIAQLLNVSKRRADLLGLDAARKVEWITDARKIAEDAGLDPDEVIEEARRLIAEAEGGTY